MSNAEAFTAEQIMQYCSRRQKSLRIDRPGVRVEFVRTTATKSAGGEGWAATGERWYIRVECDGKTAFPYAFQCIDGGPPAKSWWRPVDPEMYTEMRYAGFVGV